MKHHKHHVIGINGAPVDIHRYTLCRDIVQLDDGTLIVEKLVFSMGEHGTLHADPQNETREHPLRSGDGNKLLAEQNVAEMKRAMKEGGKWESRMRESPLGKTQQDFVAYYSEVIAAFAEWCTTNGIPVPR